MWLRVDDSLDGAGHGNGDGYRPLPRALKRLYIDMFFSMAQFPSGLVVDYQCERCCVFLGFPPNFTPRSRIEILPKIGESIEVGRRRHDVRWGCRRQGEIILFLGWYTNSKGYERDTWGIILYILHPSTSRQCLRGGAHLRPESRCPSSCNIPPPSVSHYHAHLQRPLSDPLAADGPV